MRPRCAISDSSRSGTSWPVSRARRYRRPFGGRFRQIMVYVDPAKLQAYQMSPMDVVRAVNSANLILPSGDVKIGPFDYSIFTNSQFRNVPDINGIPLKTASGRVVTV